MKKRLAAVAGIGALAVVGGSLAYFTASATFDNPLHTGHYMVDTHEDFTPQPDEWIPGAEVDKKVFAQNTGDYPVLVRVRMSEKWSRKTDNGTLGKAYIDHDSSEGLDVFNITANDEGEYNADQPDFDTTNDKTGATDGLVNGLIDGEMSEDKTVVAKKLTTDSQWFFNEDDGYWYWNGVLDPVDKNGNVVAEGKTVPLLNAIRLASNVDEGLYVTDMYYNVNNSATAPDFKYPNPSADWTLDVNKELNGLTLKALAEKIGLQEGEHLHRKSIKHLDDVNKGYADSDYVLTIDTEFVQANKDAVAATWDTLDINKLNNITVNAKDGVNYENK